MMISSHGNQYLQGLSVENVCMRGLCVTTISERKHTVRVRVVFVRADVAGEHALIASDLYYSHRGLWDLEIRIEFVRSVE